MLKTIIVLIPFLAISILIPVLIGVYVYRDAKNRGMNAALWTLVAIFAPTLIGFIIYLLVRGSYSDAKCPKCEAAVAESYISCPRCGAKLKATCPSCAAPVEAEWKVCPKCATQLPEHYDDVTAPVGKKDRALGKILLAVILIPLLLIVVMALSFGAFSSSAGGVTGVTSLPVDEYLQEVDSAQINEWMGDVGDDYSKAYALQNTGTSGQSTQVHYLIYMPCLSDNPQLSIDTSSGLFGQTTNLHITSSDPSVGNTLLLLTCSGNAASKFEIYYNGQRMNCEITKVDYPLGLTGGASKAALPGG